MLKEFDEEEQVIERFNNLFELKYLTLISNSEELITYRPLDDHPELFMEFASLKNSPDEYLKFANEYGFLRKMPFKNYDEHLSTWYGHRETIQSILIEWNNCTNNESIKEFIRKYSEWPWPGLAITLGRSFDERLPALYITPGDLHMAMILQFFQSISSNVQLRRCAVCPTWFTYGTGTGRRKSAHYCSDRCRKAAFLERKQRSKA